MTNSVVIGLGYGDEGKGVTTEYLCSQDPSNTIVVRFSGGPQAGHKVIKDGTEHIFSSFGAGSLSGCPTYWSKYCTFNPSVFMVEYNILKEKGIDPVMFIHPQAMITTPYDVLLGRFSKEKEHGTTGHGIFRTIQRHLKINFNVSNLFHDTPNQLKQKLKEIEEYSLKQQHIDGQIIIEDFMWSVWEIRHSLHRERVMESNVIPYSYKNKVFEGSQGLMLDEFIGHMPHCTPTDVTIKPIHKMGQPLDEIFLVTRCYQTRHGNGPMTNEKYQIAPNNDEKETNQSNCYQGSFRKTVLDLDQLIHAKDKGIDKFVDSKTKINLVVTCMDQLEEYDLTKLGLIHKFPDPDTFSKYLGKMLNINGKIYTNNSPESKLKEIG